MVASVNLGYTLMGMTRFGVQVDRDVQFSYEQCEPYYILTGVTGTITQRLSARGTCRRAPATSSSRIGRRS